MYDDDPSVGFDVPLATLFTREAYKKCRPSPYTHLNDRDASREHGDTSVGVNHGGGMWDESPEFGGC